MASQQLSIPVNHAHADTADVSPLPEDLSPRSVRHRPRRSTSTRRKLSRKISISRVVQKSCWICLDDNSDIKGGFVHACSCSLFAHEKCLLSWIAEAQKRSRSATAAKTVIVCPQCQEAYKLSQDRSPLLELIQRLDLLYSKLTVRLTLGAAVAGLSFASGAYGYYAGRLFLGPQMSDRYFGKKLTWQTCFNLPFVLPLLILARTSVLDSVMPLIPISLLSIPSPFALFTGDSATLVAGVPSPSMVLISLPWFRLVYHRLRSLVAAFLIKEEVEPEEDDEAIQGEAHFEVGQDPEQENRQNQGEQEPAARHIEAHLVFGSRAISRLFFGSLALPFISYLCGHMLLKLTQATRSSLLRRLLGLRDADLFALALKNAGMSTMLNLPIKAQGQSHANLSASWTDYIRSFFPVGTSSSDGRIDPVWWRTTIGGCSFVVLKDMFAILKAFLEMKQRASRKIRSVDISPDLELNLRPSLSPMSLDESELDNDSVTH